MVTFHNFLREFVEDIWATDDALEAWGRGDTDWPLSLKQFMAYVILMGLAFTGGAAGVAFFRLAR